MTPGKAVIRNVCLRTFFIRDAMPLRLSRDFLPLSDRAYVSGVRCIGLFLL